jgi:hypothetical protein
VTRRGIPKSIKGIEIVRIKGHGKELYAETERAITGAEVFKNAIFRSFKKDSGGGSIV